MDAHHSGNSPESDSIAVEPVGAEAEAEDSTVGTGSAFAIGCTLLTLFLALIGVAFFVGRQIF